MQLQSEASVGCENEKNSWRNGLALGLVVGACACLILLSTISAIPVDGSNSTSDWRSSISSVLSVVISIIAVILVAATLKTTEETLRETKQIGLNQTRAWLLVKSLEISQSRKTDKIDIRVTFHNYGASPAINILSEVYAYTDPYPFVYARALEELTSDFAISSLPPGVDYHRFITDWPIPSSDEYRTRIRISLSYKILDETVVSDFVEWVVISDKNQFHARPFMPVDRQNYAVTSAN
ncbi:hypothetical protein [Paracoccus marcusii]|uniref:Uncharacterized protein n=1 Tax=Paracoccus marcusii TaxID=59779 RepID=A0ABY7USJ6_9RHOB|nr:hypothetical protein [Paracoccus marcusii]WDA11829.1 hypothetical protein PRL19_11035 [Paracoccus marcusii]